MRGRGLAVVFEKTDGSPSSFESISMPSDSVPLREEDPIGLSLAGFPPWLFSTTSAPAESAPPCPAVSAFPRRPPALRPQGRSIPT